MDVILDANTYLQDTRMEGTQFQELFTYLRRTGCFLVVPRPVLLEAVGRYRDMLSLGVQELRKAWHGVRRRSMSSMGEFKSPVDIDEEVCSFEQRLKGPAPRVKVSLYDDYSAVNLEEVVLRGVERIRPANEKGEELRDVILWLMVLAYAKKFQRKVAFVSDDHHFRSHDVLHERLASDVARIGVEVSFYRGVKDLIAGNSLETEVLTEKLLFSLVSSDSIKKEVAKGFEESRTIGGSTQKVEIDSIRFLNGKKYKVAEDSFYMESVLNGTARVMIREVANMITAVSPAFHIPPEGNTIMANVVGDSAHLVSNATLPGGPWYLDGTVLQPAVIGARALIGQGYYQGGVVQGTSGFVLDSVEKLYRCQYQIEVSARIERGELIALQTDDFRVVRMESVPDLGSPDFDLPKVE